MKQYQKIISFLLSIALVFSICILPTQADYVVQYGYAAEALWEDGLFLGTGNSFDLDKPLTRAAGATMIVRLLGKEAEAKAGSYTIPFTDVLDWAKPYVGYCYTNGIVNGTSATTFSSNDEMTAAQYITLVLRALGYDDTAGDFSWDKAPAKALEIGLIGQSCYKQYTTTDLFLRDNAAVIAYNALSQKLKGKDTELKSTIILPGKPSGTMPAYISEDSGTNTPKPGADVDENIATLMDVLNHIEGAMYLKVTKASSRHIDGGETVTRTTYANSAIDGLFSYGFKTACKFSSPQITSANVGSASDSLLTAAITVRSGDYNFKADPVGLRVVFLSNSLLLDSDLTSLQKIFNNPDLDEQSVKMIGYNAPRRDWISAIIYLPDSEGVLRGQYLLCNTNNIGEYSVYKNCSCALLYFNAEDSAWTFNGGQMVRFASGSVTLVDGR